MNKKVLIWNMLLVVLVVVSVKKSSAQKKELKQEKLEITINNGDTTVNGKNFKNITEEEKVELRKKFEPMEGRKFRLTTDPAGYNKRVRIIRKGDGDLAELDSGRRGFYSFNDDGKNRNFEVKIDSLRKNMSFFPQDSNKDVREFFVKRFGDGANIDWEMVHPQMSRGENMAPMQMNNDRAMTIHRPNMPNSSHFDFTTTDKDGFTTEQHINVMDPNKSNLDLLKKSKEDLSSLEIKNLVFYPNFSSGKTNISFQAPTKASLEIHLLNNEGEVFFSEKKTLTADTYTKDIALTKNGIYYLEVKQGSKSFIKKIIKN
ncbi:MAG: T9SS type A sorting domain-containing protein [Bacteroidetes bacterium]|nr:T9SS type A sorting domain-containing protein [Bacteroidota bacterium]